MARTSSTGNCRFCGKSYSKGRMGRHLETCVRRKADLENESGKTTVYQLKIEAAYILGYWLFIEIPGTVALQRLDQFLRDIWLECCGHLSEFIINNVSYMRHPYDEYLDMSPELTEVLQPEQKFAYTYDFGSSTELLITVMGHRKGKLSKIRILARNNTPDILCDCCQEKQATRICTQCLWEATGRLCDNCAIEHDCGEEMMLEIVNSPRSGVCGYEGPSIEPG